MKLPIYQVDAFTSKIFEGNPAAVIPLDDWLPDDVMQQIAIENNLSETAFFKKEKDNYFLRWFTPTYEIDLCGHATLASSYIILNEIEPGRETVTFHTKQAGDLVVQKNDNLYTLDFPARPGEKVDIETLPKIIFDALGGHKPVEALKARDLMLVYDDEEFLRTIQPDFSKLIQYEPATIITSQTSNEEFDFISRFFCPYDMGIPEDPVTGSAHCTLTPYWAEKLNKTKLRARQVSERGGNLNLELKKDRVHISGEAVMYLKGYIYV